MGSSGPAQSRQPQSDEHQAGGHGKTREQDTRDRPVQGVLFPLTAGVHGRLPDPQAEGGQDHLHGEGHEYQGE